jgi:hypothetical protein
VSGQRQASAALYPGEKTPGTHCTGGWMELRAGLKERLQEKFFPSAGDRTPLVQFVVRHYANWATPASNVFELFHLIIIIIIIIII